MICGRRTTWRICARTGSWKKWAQEFRRRTRRRFVARKQARVVQRAMDGDARSRHREHGGDVGHGRGCRRRYRTAVLAATVVCPREVLAQWVCGENVVGASARQANDGTRGGRRAVDMLSR
jgi:hypothetical protein